MRETDGTDRKGRPMPDIEVEIEVYCAKCGEGLCGQTEAVRTHGRRAPAFRVTPCQRCLDEKYDEGFEDGQDSIDDDGIDP